MPLTVDPQALYNGISKELVPEKFEKYILLLLISILLTLIPFGTGQTPLYCKHIPTNAVTNGNARYDEPYSSSDESVGADKETSAVTRNGKGCSENNVRGQLNSNEPIRPVKSSDNLATDDSAVEGKAPPATRYRPSANATHCFAPNASRANSKVCCTYYEAKANATSLKYSVPAGEDITHKDSQSVSNEFDIDEQIAEKACPGQRAKDYVMCLGWCFIIVIAWISTHDLWIYFSDKEIRKLKEIVESNKIMKICDECMKSLLRQKLKEFCDKCGIKKPAKAWSQKRALLQNLPKLDYLLRNYNRQNWFSLVMLAALSVPYWLSAPAYSYWFECDVELPQYHSSSRVSQILSFKCYDANIDIVTGTLCIMLPFVIVLLCSFLCKVMYAGAPYFRIFTALRNNSSGR